jgi:hypothetical protein
MEEVLDSISAQKVVYWSSLDLRSGYWQTELDPDTADRTGFQTHEGNYAFKRTPFGLCGAVQFFQMVMQKVLRGLAPSKVLIYLDDILVMGKDPQDMFQKLDEVFQRFRGARLRIHPAKCHWAVKRVKFLGHIFDERGIGVDESKFSIIRHFPVPTTPKRVRSFLGLANYYRRFVKGFSQISATLRALLKADAKFEWTPQCQEAFEKLKEMLINAPILKLPDFGRPFVLTTDASTSGIAHILGQRDDQGCEHAVAYGGRGLRPNETRWAVTELECLALIEGVKQFHTYLSGSKFEVVTDHISLTFLRGMKLAGNNRLTRWALFLQPYTFTITYKKGALLTSADAISRMDNLPTPSPTDEEVDTADAPLIATVTSGRTLIEFDLSSAETVIAAGTVFPQPATIATGDNEIGAELERCPDLAPVWRYLTKGDLPADDQAARRIVIEAADYMVIDGRLYHLYTPRTKNLQRAVAVVKQMCVPTALRARLAQELHDDNNHLGFDRLYCTARTRYYWPGMYAFLREHVLTCLDYQQAKRPVHPDKTPIVSLPVPAPANRWHLDFHGPLPESEGRRHILVLIDSTSMWPELIPVEDTSAETAVRALFDNVVARFGMPREISALTDNGSAFISKLANLTCKTFGIKQYFTTPFHPQTNARAEELAATIHNALRLLCEKQKDWPTHLQAVALAYRASTTTNTGLSPHEVLFGRPMRLAIDWTLMAGDPTIPSVQHYAREIGPKLEILHQIAMSNVQDSAASHSRRRNEAAEPPKYAAGDKVLLHDPRVKKGESHKLKRPYTGPFIITECRPGFNYRLQDANTGRDLKRAVHADRLRPLKEMANDYRLPKLGDPVTVAEGTLGTPTLRWKVTVGNPMPAAGTALVRFANSPDAEGDVNQLVTLAPPTSTDDQEAWKQLYADGFAQADGKSSRVVNFDQSGVITEKPYDVWPIAQAAAEAVRTFAAQTDTRHVEEINFNCDTLSTADTLRTVFSSLLKDQSETTSPNRLEDEVVESPGGDLNAPARDPNQWYEIEAVLKRQKRASKDMFLVRWKGTKETSWVKRQDLSPAALQQFYAEHGGRKRRRRH